MVGQPIPASYARMIARELAGSASIQQLLAGTGLSEQRLRLADTITLEQLLAILRNAGVATADPAIGLKLGGFLHPSTHGPVGWATINSPTLGDAVAVLSRYLVLQVPFMKYEPAFEGGEFCVRITSLADLADQSTVLKECALMLLHQVISFIVMQTPADSSICVDYPEPPYAARYPTLFGCDVAYEQQVVEYRLPRTYADFQNSNANDEMYQIALDQCRDAERRLLAQTDLEEQIYQLLRKHLQEHLTLEQVAERLNVSPRTLIRRLKKVGCSFQSIADRLYSQTASDYLQRTDISVNAVAQLLGYPDPANFRRSFKRWFDVTPGEYRNRGS